MDGRNTMSEALNDLRHAIIEALRLDKLLDWMAANLLLTKILMATFILAFWALLALETGLL